MSTVQGRGFCRTCPERAPSEMSLLISVWLNLGVRGCLSLGQGPPRVHMCLVPSRQHAKAVSYCQNELYHHQSQEDRDREGWVSAGC